MRKTAIGAILVVIGCCGTIEAGEPRSVPEAVGWLQGHARTMIRASRRPMKDGVAAFLPQAGGGYDAFWLRDYVYMVEGSADAFSNKELTDACRVFVNGQRADGACVDCVRLDGAPIYKPGGGTMGENPVADGSQFTVAVAWHTYRRVHDRAFLEPIVGRLLKAMEAVPRNPATGLVHIRPGGYDRCPYGFTDTVREQGDVLFCSLLQVEASLQLADLLAAVGRPADAEKWRTEADRLAATIRTVFWDQSLGLFRAATVQCKEPDIWGSAFAVYLGVASREQSLAVARYFQQHYDQLVERGQVRHLPGGMYWRAAGPKDEYQNGGFWATPTGWFVYALDLVDPSLADRTVLDMVDDFRQRGIMEWVLGAKKGVPDYVASAALPIAGIEKMLERRRAAHNSAATGNLLRNAGFELDGVFNGGPMRQGTEFIRAVRLYQGNCPPAPCEGWWIDQNPGDGVSLEQKDVHSGLRALRIAPPAGQKLSVVSAPEMPVPAGALVLTAWVRTAGAKASLELELVAAGARADQDPGSLRSLSRRQIALPETAAEWTHVELTNEAPADAAAVVRLAVDAGRVVADDLQLETGRTPTAFNVRREEWLKLSFDGTPESRLPCWMAEDDVPRKLLVRNDSRVTIDGDLEIWAGPWSQPKSEKVAAVKNIALQAGGVAAIPLRTGHWKPDAYVVSAVLRRDGQVLLDGPATIDPSTAIGGAASSGLLKSRAAIRFALGPKVEPARIFGVGNGMLDCGWQDCTGSWFGGWPLRLFAAARDHGFVCGRGPCATDDRAYLFAAAGVPFHRMESQRLEFGAPPGSPFEVPGEKGGIDLWNPQGMALMKANAAEVGKANAENALVVSYQMDNESMFPFFHGLCPTAAADAHFRQWCQKRHGDLGALNRRWGTSYQSWDEVEQPASARYVEEIKKRPRPQGAAAVDWTASLGTLTPEIHKRMLAVPGRGMDWGRWRTSSSLWAYDTFRASARQHDHKTLYSSNLCWPNFSPQMSMPFFRHMDATMLDAQYTAGTGLSRGLGTPMEMMEILELAESNAPDKPLWGIEIYTQPQWPAEFGPLQNWGLLAHGMRNTLVFAWGPYSDYGIPKEPRAWEKSDAKAMYVMIDLDGKKLPGYFSNQRSVREIEEFHRRYDGLSLRRAPTDVAFFVSRDTAEYGGLESANRPWLSTWIRTRSNLCYLLRLGGISADFVDDETLPTAPGRFRTVIVPAAYVLSQETAERLARFAHGGGTVILAGASGVVDPWLNKYPNLAGPAWAELGWVAGNFRAETANVEFRSGKTVPTGTAERKPFKGVDIGTMPGAQPIRDGRGSIVGWTRPWGSGKLAAYGVLPDCDLYNTNPHPSPNQTAWIKQLITVGGLGFSGRWTSSEKIENRSDKHGEGDPIVEVVVRVRKGREAQEKFIFVLNRGGAGRGLVEVPLAGGVWQATDALSGPPVTSAVAAHGLWRFNLAMKPWEYRVFRLTSKGG